MNKKCFTLILIIVGISSLAFQGQFARRIFPIFTDPATPCIEGSVYYQMITHKFLICKDTGIEEVGSGAGGGIIPEADATTTGLLKSIDWVTFNSKQPLLGFTPENSANKNATNGYAGLISGKISLGQISEVLSILDLNDYSTSSGSGTTAIKSTINSAATNDILTWSGTNWVNAQPIISQVFGRTGVISPQSGDYNASQVTNAFDTNVSNTLTNVAAPTNPIAGRLAIWADITDTVLKVKNNSGVVSLTVRPNTCTGTDKVSAISTAGLIICSADQTGAGSGIITLNGLNQTSQNFADVDDSNITLAINSSVDIHTFTVGWTGLLPKSRMVTTTVHTDQVNTFGAFAQTFQAGTLFRLIDPANNTKVAQFDLSNISSATTRTINIPDANSTTIQSSTAPANQFANSISAQGIIGYSQPSFSSLSGSATDAQIPDSHTVTTISNLTSNGFVKTSGGIGTLVIDTNTYITGNQTITLTGNVTGSGTTSISTTIANNVVTGAMIAIGSDTTGDILYYNGTDYVRLPIGANGNVLSISSGIPVWGSAGSGDMILASVQTVTGAKTFNATKLIIGTNAGAPAVVANSFYRDTSDGFLYIGSNDGTAWNEIFENNVSGPISADNGGTGFNSYTKGDILVASGATTLVKLTVGANGLCIKANSATSSGLEYGTCGSGGGSGDVVGPSSATDNAIVRFDLTTGKLVQNSGVTIDDSANMSTAGSLTVGVGSTTAGFIEFGQGNAPSLGTTSIQLYAPTSVTSYQIKYPSVAASGIPHYSNSSNVITMSISAINLASADITGDLPYANLVQSTTASKLIGRGSASGAGDFEEITIGSGLTMTGTTLSASGGSGLGDFVGPSSSLDNAIVRFDGTTGKLGQDSVVTIADTTGNISSPGNISLGVGGSVAGNVELGQGTAPSLGTTSILLYAPTSVTSYAIVYPTAAATGIPHFQNSSNVITMSIAAINLASADVTGILPVANGGSGVATITGILKGNGTSAFSAAIAGTDYTSPASTEVFTNKTFDVEGTGNIFTSPKRLWFDAAGCNGSNASPNFDLPTSAAPTASCTGTTTTVGALDFIDASTTSATRRFRLPASWTGNIDINLLWFANTTSTNAVRWQVSIGCVADGEVISTGPSYNTASVNNEAYVGGTANFGDSTSFTNVAKTNCSALETAWIKVERVGGDAGDTLTTTANLSGMEVIIRTVE